MIPYSTFLFCLGGAFGAILVMMTLRRRLEENEILKVENKKLKQKLKSIESKGRDKE